MGDRAGQRRHCWVVLPDVDPMPGVVAGWRRADADGWEARVAYALEDETGGVVIDWLPASVLRPHDAVPGAGEIVPPQTPTEAAHSVKSEEVVVPVGDGLPELVGPAAASAVREWARAGGLPVTSTGRLPDQVLAAYAAFHAYEGRRNSG